MSNKLDAELDARVRRKKMAVLPPDPLYRFKADLGHLHSLCFLQTSPRDTDEEPEKHLLLAAGESGIVHFIDLEDNRVKHQRRLGVSIQTILVHKDELIVQEKEGLVTFYRLSDDRCEKTASVRCASGFCKMVRLRDMLLLPLEDAGVAVYDLEGKSVARTLQHADAGRNYGQLMCLEAGLVDGADVLFAGYETGDVLLWSVTTSGASLAHAKFNECVITMAYDSTARRGVVGGAGDVLQVFALDAAAGRVIRPLAELALTNAGCEVARVRPDRKVLVSGGCDGRTRLHSWRTLRPLAVLAENRASVVDVQFSAAPVPQWASRVMAVAGADGVVTLWNLYEQTPPPV